MRSREGDKYICLWRIRESESRQAICRVSLKKALPGKTAEADKTPPVLDCISVNVFAISLVSESALSRRGREQESDWLFKSIILFFRCRASMALPFYDIALRARTRTVSERSCAAVVPRRRRRISPAGFFIRSGNLTILLELC